MLNYNVKIGLCPLRRNTTNRPAKTFLTWVSAEERGQRFVNYIEEKYTSENVTFVDTKGLGINDLIFDDASASAAAERFKAEGVDAILIINCNFGNEEAAADLAKAVGKPVCIWAPLDDEYYVDGVRPTDSQCGSFGLSRQMQRYHIPFSHIISCEHDSEEFDESFNRFIRVSCMVKNFTGLRIGQVGTRPAPFFSVIWNEGELMEKFGIRIIPFNYAIIQNKFNEILATEVEEIAKFVKFFKENYKYDEMTEVQLDKMAAAVILFKQLFEENKLDGMSGECWTAFPQMFDGFCPCAVYGVLNDLGYIVACESDIHVAMTMALLRSASLGKKTPFLGEFTVRHPENKNAELLWHCGPFPLSVKAQSGIDSTARLVNQREWFRGKDGTYTVARIDQESGNYMVLPLVCKTVEGPQTHGTYIWGEFEDLKKVEDRLFDGPYIHHFCEMEGDYRAEFKEFCKYFPNLSYDDSVEK